MMPGNANLPPRAPSSLACTPSTGFYVFYASVKLDVWEASQQDRSPEVDTDGAGGGANVATGKQDLPVYSLPLNQEGGWMHLLRAYTCTIWSRGKWNQFPPPEFDCTRYLDLKED